MVGAVAWLAVGSAAASSSGVPPDVESVAAGGWWQSGERSGRYRVVTRTQGFEHVGVRVYVEWLAEADSPTAAGAVVATVEPALGEAEGASLAARLEPVAAGCARIRLRGARAEMPSQRYTLSFWALGPGELVPVVAGAATPAPCRAVPSRPRHS